MTWDFTQYIPNRMSKIDSMTDMRKNIVIKRIETLRKSEADYRDKIRGIFEVFYQNMISRAIKAGVDSEVINNSRKLGRELLEKKITLGKCSSKIKNSDEETDLGPLLSMKSNYRQLKKQFSNLESFVQSGYSYDIKVNEDRIKQMEIKLSEKKEELRIMQSKDICFDIVQTRIDVLKDLINEKKSLLVQLNKEIDLLLYQLPSLEQERKKLENCLIR